MLFVYCKILILVSFLVNCGIASSVPEQDKTDLNEYAKEVRRFIDSLPLSNNTSHERLYKQTDFESFNKNTSVSYDEISHYSDTKRSSSERVMPVDEAKLSGPHELTEAPRDILPFSIDKGINSSSTTGNQSQQCHFDRQYITSMFKECIYIQAALRNPTDTVNPSEPSVRDYDARFLKYCRRAPQLRSCVKNMILSKIQHCLDEGVVESIDNVDHITEHIIKFICIKESDRISIFISDGGLECLLSSNWRTHMCLSLYLGSYVVLSLFELPSLNLENIKCVNLQSAQRCVEELESCEDPTSAVVARLLFHIAMEVAACSDTAGTISTTTATERSDLSRLLSVRDGKHTTEGTIHLNPQLAAELEHVETTEQYISSVPSDENQTYHASTVGPILSDVLAASGNSYSSISSKELETASKPPNCLDNATTPSNHNSTATTVGLLCGLLMFSITILMSYKCIVKTHSQAQRTI